MMPTQQGSIRLFRFAGIDVFLHWSWFLVLFYFISVRAPHSTPLWNIVECLALFFIVLLHEFGHSLACRQTGGRADKIVLWPLGGVAYVAPPPRPGAMLWSIAAGPLVNLLLIPVLFGMAVLARWLGWPEAMPEAYSLLRFIGIINLIILIFNLLPVYPLDGGQILRSLLWFVVGRARSLMIATVIGLAGAAGLIALAFRMESIWMGILSVFILMNCWGGFQEARRLCRLARGPRHHGFACASCRSAPPVGTFWLCGSCRQPFDMFASGAICPRCAAQFSAVQCVECGGLRPLREWSETPPLLTRTPND